MVLQIGGAISRGVRRSVSPAGFVLTLLTLLYAGLFLGSVNTLVVTALPPAAQQGAQIGFTLPVPAAAAGALAVAALVFGIGIYIAAARAFTRDDGSVSAELFTRRMGRAVLSGIGANVVVGVSVLVGLALLVIPGVFLMVSFAFVVFAIAVEDARLLESLRRSWALARGNRWRLAALVLLVGVVSALVSSLGSLASIVDPAAGQVVSLLVTAPLAVVNYAIIADAFLQVREQQADGGFEA